MHDGLRHQHPIKRIRMVARQLACVERGFLIDLQRRNATRFADPRDKKIRPLGREGS
jgi:hypothetical protein